MMEGRPDWCISRQRTWGVPITFFVHKETGELHPRTAELIEQVAQRIEQQGIEAWFELDAAELLGDEAEHYEKMTDTLDVWFDSGVTHACVLEKTRAAALSGRFVSGRLRPASRLVSVIIAGIVAMNDVAPYKAVLTHGFTVDADGKKMSKSKGNVVAPQSVMKDLGADVLRLWVAATDYRGEMTVSDEILKRTSDGYRRLEIPRDFCCPIWMILTRRNIRLIARICWRWIAGLWIELMRCRKKLKRPTKRINSSISTRKCTIFA